MKTNTARIMRMLQTFNRFLRYVAHQDETDPQARLRQLRRERAHTLRTQRRNLHA